MCKREESRSDVQKEMETIIFKKLQLEPGDQNIDGIKLIFDGVKKENAEITEIYEIYCGIEKLKSAQKQKIAKDLLKMIFFEKLKGQTYKKKIIVIDEDIKKSLSIENHKTWLNQAINTYKVEIEVFEATCDQRQKIKTAKKNQNLMQK
ncbi:MAG TPA: hypothetical protein PLW37_14385 [bacterium]|nr:hypothetical protein [bacterium]HQB11048.1 hypothetical protein [bacterium]